MDLVTGSIDFECQDDADEACASSAVDWPEKFVLKFRVRPKYLSPRKYVIDLGTGRNLILNAKILPFTSANLIFWNFTFSCFTSVSSMNLRSSISEYSSPCFVLECSFSYIAGAPAWFAGTLPAMVRDTLPLQGFPRFSGGDGVGASRGEERRRRSGGLKAKESIQRDLNEESGESEPSLTSPDCVAWRWPPSPNLTPKEIQESSHEDVGYWGRCNSQEGASRAIANSHQKEIQNMTPQRVGYWVDAIGRAT
nr:hypothetical protein Iba_chr15fCG5150 [Ipomoea batatas]